MVGWLGGGVTPQCQTKGAWLVGCVQQGEAAGRPVAATCGAKQCDCAARPSGRRYLPLLISCWPNFRHVTPRLLPTRVLKGCHNSTIRAWGGGSPSRVRHHPIQLRIRCRDRAHHIQGIRLPYSRIIWKWLPPPPRPQTQEASNVRIGYQKMLAARPPPDLGDACQVPACSCVLQAASDRAGTQARGRGGTPGFTGAAGQLGLGPNEPRMSG